MSALAQKMLNPLGGRENIAELARGIDTLLQEAT